MKTISQPYRKNHLLLDSTANVAVIAAAALVLASVMFSSFSNTTSTEQLASRTPDATRVIVATAKPVPAAVAYRASTPVVAAQ